MQKIAEAAGAEKRRKTAAGTAELVAIFLCGGRGARMRGSVPDKILAPLAGTPVLAHSLRAFEAAGIFTRAIFVFRDEAQRAEIAGLAAQFAPRLASAGTLFCVGGTERRDSVFNALSAATDFFEKAGKSADSPLVFIHDCARPLVRSEFLRTLAETALREGAAVAAHRCRNTVKRVPAGTPDGKACAAEDLDRARLWETETPQVFALGKIFAAYKAAKTQNLAPTDDVGAAAAAGVPVAFVENPFPNPKLTLPEDFLFCEAVLRSRGE